MRLDPDLCVRLYRAAKAERWDVPHQTFVDALEASSGKAFPASAPGKTELIRYFESLHLEDLALACACALGNHAAWDHFVLEMRPALYRAAEALDRSGGARELADSLYADLYGIGEGNARRSLLRYFHGRSSLATWLRAVLAQRHIDALRAARRHEPLPADERHAGGTTETSDPDCGGLVARLRDALRSAMARLDARDRLRLSCYYAEQLTLAETGRLLKEHEATVSRKLARTRTRVRQEVERELRAAGLSPAQVARCFECATEDAGDMDLRKVLAVGSFNRGESM